MPESARRIRKLPYRSTIAGILLVGATLSVVLYLAGRADERAKAEAEFSHRALLQHALIREIFVHYEDALFGLSTLFISSDEVTALEFSAAARRIGSRISGVQALEWAPVVPAAERPQVEALLSSLQGRPVEFIEFGPDGAPRRAQARDEHNPIIYIEPLAGNETALGYDLKTSGNRPFIEQARQTGRMTLTAPFRLVQERGQRLGVVMCCPVYRTTPDGERFGGVLICVFGLRDLLEAVYGQQYDPELDVLFVDASESDPVKRLLHHKVAGGAEPEAVSEAEFKTGLHRELALPFGGRQWRALVRPRSGWIAQQLTATPVLRSAAVLALAGLAAGIVLILGRRNDTIEREVSERTKELAESRRQITHMLHALPGMAYRCSYDEHLNVLFLSEGAFALTGWTADELMSGVKHFRDCIHPDDIARVRESTRRALEDQDDVDVEYRIRTRSGDEKWVLSRGKGVYNAEGDLRFFEGLAIDITAQKRAEVARLEIERKMLEGQKLESIGLLAGGIAHDFNNLLGSIVGNVGIARLDLSPDHPAGTPLRAIESASMRAAELCRQMLAYAGKGRFVVEPIELTALVEDLLPLLKVSVSQHGTLRLRLTKPLPAVMADATQVRQIVMNLVLNAADAVSSGKGEIVVTTGTMQADVALLAECAVGAELPPGTYVFLEVRDNGTGMKPEVLAKIFDPFFTTKFAGRGLGLAAVLGIVRGHKGALQVESEAGAGSTFRLLLPPDAAQPVPVRPPDPSTGRRWQRLGTVLVVEDEEPVRTVAVALLKSFGLTPLPVADGASAIALFKQEAMRIDLVLLDLLMPVMRGEDVLAELRKIRPEVRVLLMSGYSEGDVLGRIPPGEGKLDFLGKPFTAAVLEGKLRELLA